MHATGSIPKTASIETAGSAKLFALAAGGAGLVLVGVALGVPWITVFRGLQPIPGFVLEGGPLAGVLLGAVGLLLVGATIGGSRVLRPIALIATVAVIVDAVLLQMRIADYVANPGPAAPLTQPTAGVGAALMAAGAALLLVAIAASPVRRHRLERSDVVRLLLAGFLLIAGWIHLLLVPQHMDESPILGIGFAASGVTQLALAALVTWRPRDWNLAAVVAVNVTLIAIYAYAVFVGLPFGGGSEHEAAAGLVVGAGEPIDAFGAISKVAELAGVAIAFQLLGKGRPVVTA